jgi:hypothetical protein
MFLISFVRVAFSWLVAIARLKREEKLGEMWRCKAWRKIWICKVWRCKMWRCEHVRCRDIRCKNVRCANAQ